jgi:hypothetical protein
MDGEESISIKRQVKKLEVLGIILAVIASVAAGPSARGDQTLSAYWENDGSYIKPICRTDRHYTDGLKLVYTHQPELKWLKDFGKWNNFTEGDANVDTALGYFFGQNMYTPDHADDPGQRIKDDRVFAGWVYGGIFAQRAKQDQMEHFELNLGLIGPSAQAGRTQEVVHGLLRIKKPKGWEDQLGNEFHADFTWYKRQRADLFVKHTSNFDAHLEYGFTAGSLHRNANLSLLLRYGFDLPDDFGPGRLEAPACTTGKIKGDRRYFYIFGRIGGKLVQYDRFLSGLSEKTAVGQLQVGVAFRYKNIQISYSQTFLTREYREQPSADSIGALNLTWYF